MQTDDHEDLRLERLISGGRQIDIFLDGQRLAAREGESVAGALWAAGIRTLRTTARKGSPRGIFCASGDCWDCLVTVDGQPNQRACRTTVRAGMQITTQAGFGQWS